MNSPAAVLALAELKDRTAACTRVKGARPPERGHGTSSSESADVSVGSCRLVMLARGLPMLGARRGMPAGVARVVRRGLLAAARRSGFTLMRRFADDVEHGTGHCFDSFELG
jgi:hypothetical protein